jgi:radical SAM-linked protein
MRVRIRYSKLGKVRFTSHRDMARIWERALRKTMTPVAYSVGFTPRPKMAFGLALPTGAESMAEYLDVELAEAMNIAELAEKWTTALPPGFRVVGIEEIDRSGLSLQEDVAACTWELTLRDTTFDAAIEACETALRADSLSLERERKGERRLDDVRPAVVSLDVEHGSDNEGNDAPMIRAVLAIHPRSLRPSEALAVCFPQVSDVTDISGRVLRTHQWIEREGERRELSPLPDPLAAHIAEAVGV